MALLAVSLIAAPVLGSLPRCCQTGEIAGGGNCCCGPRAEVEETASCCQSAERSCCAESEPEDTELAETTPAAEQAPCSCRAISQPPAIVSGKDRIESHENQLSVIAVAVVDGTAVQLNVASAWELHQVEPPGIALHKIFCRWTV